MHRQSVSADYYDGIDCRLIKLTIVTTIPVPESDSSLSNHFVSDIAIFVLKRDVKLQLTN